MGPGNSGPKVAKPGRSLSSITQVLSAKCIPFLPCIIFTTCLHAELSCHGLLWDNLTLPLNRVGSMIQPTLTFGDILYFRAYYISIHIVDNALHDVDFSSLLSSSKVDHTVPPFLYSGLASPVTLPPQFVLSVAKIVDGIY